MTIQSSVTSMSGPSNETPNMLEATAQESRKRDAELPIRQRRRYGSVVAAVVVTVVLAYIIQSFARSKAAEWSVVWQYLFNARIAHGALVTVELTALSMGIALVIAVIVALMRLSDTWALRKAAVLFVWFFRSTPVLVLLVITFNIALFFPRIRIALGGDVLFSEPTNSVISAYWAAVVAFSLNEAAYSAEIIRTSILAVSPGQSEAGVALGMTSGRVYRRIVLPQALRIAIPPLGNDTINMLKGTSLVAFIAVFDLMYTAQSIYQVTYQIVPLLIVVTFWYIAMVSALSVVQAMLERRLRPRSKRSGPVSVGAGPGIVDPGILDEAS